MKLIAALRKNHTFWLQVVMWLSLTLSVLAVPIAIWLKDPSFGQRGGALGVALSFAILFLGKSTPKKSLMSKTVTLDELRPEKNPSASKDVDEKIADLQAQIDRLDEAEIGIRGALSSMLDWNDKEKIYLTYSSVISTLFWGFGDCVTKLAAYLLGISLA